MSPIWGISLFAMFGQYDLMSFNLDFDSRGVNRFRFRYLFESRLLFMEYHFAENCVSLESLLWCWTVFILQIM